MGHLEWLTALADQLDRMHDVTVTRDVVRGGRDRDIEDLTNRVMQEIGRTLKREGLL